MKIPYTEISERLKKPLRHSQCRQAILMYCREKKTKMADIELLMFIEWMRDGLTWLRVGCSGKVFYTSRKKAKQKLKKFTARHENDGVYQCAHCGRWHITSNLLEPQGEVYAYYLYGTKLI